MFISLNHPLQKKALATTLHKTDELQYCEGNVVDHVWNAGKEWLTIFPKGCTTSTDILALLPESFSEQKPPIGTFVSFDMKVKDYDRRGHIKNLQCELHRKYLPGIRRFLYRFRRKTQYFNNLLPYNG
ncbi:unnamed protein product [Caenorhabditis auriculariae]|uniref:Uncharacterized protein n=1 Tax=Caenorhabditis auriculariae TaxID=2777116 RepID=A0A8S1H5X2_9PELO|nr:unnamed protein product [Caenorhabditis auriculariae]